ncbi:MAG: DUF4249 family protein [Melioribacteraceae bacterium]|nr:DUF4249 family protein [Melioribacteraceae bacterium]
MKNIFLILITITLLQACGDPSVNLEEVKYEPKITVEAYLYPEDSVSDIKIMRNFQLGEKIDIEKLYLTPDKNSTMVSINGIPLEFDSEKSTYFNRSIIIDYAEEYTLEISASIDNLSLSASSTTITPEIGFKLKDQDLGIIKYGIEKPTIEYFPSPGTDFYAFSVIADSASIESFIFDNSFNPDMDIEDVEEGYNNFLFQGRYFSNVNSYYNGTYKYIVDDFDSWFYGPYTVIAYAGDKNFKEYLFTAKNVKEMDGNFHEPKVLFEGDAIGVFASAIRDTIHFNIVK